MSKESKQLKAKVFKILAIGVPVVLFAWSIWYSQGVKEDKFAQIPAIYEIKSDDYIKGATSSAKVVLIEYLDFECEACKAYYPLVKELEKDFPNDLKIVTRYYPLPGHKNGLPAALAVEAAARQGKYQEMHDIMFDNQDKWGEKGMPTPQVFEGFASVMGLDMTKFKEDVNSESVKSRVQRDVKEGGILGNTGTPSFYLQGKKLENPQSYEDFKSIIQAEIDKANK
jgi:protein-disulfide isomerase